MSDDILSALHATNVLLALILACLVFGGVLRLFDGTSDDIFEAKHQIINELRGIKYEIQYK